MSICIKKQNGISLTEVLVSVFILISALCFVLTTFVVGRMSVSRVKHRIEARNILQAEMEELKNTPYSQVDDAAPANVIIDPGNDFMKGTSDDLIGSKSVSVTDLSGYKKVIVTLSWKELGWGGPVAVKEELVTYINIWSIYQWIMP